MLIQNIFSWGVVAMLSSLFLSTGSVDRNSTSSLNGLNASSKEMKEAKGCATNFQCPPGTLPFYYDHTDYSQTNVQDVTKWFPSNIGGNDCDNKNQLACLICVHESFTEPAGVGSERKLLDNFNINTSGSTSEAYVSGSDDPFMTIINRTK